MWGAAQEGEGVRCKVTDEAGLGGEQAVPHVMTCDRLCTQHLLTDVTPIHSS